MTLDYKDTQAFVGADGKPKSPAIVADTPFVKVTNRPEVNQTGVGTRYGGGAFVKLTQIGSGLIIDGNGNVSVVGGLGPVIFPLEDKDEGESNAPIIPPTDANLQTSDITQNDVSTGKHGFVPRATGFSSQYLGGDAAYHTLPFGITYYWSAVADVLGGLYDAMDVILPGASSQITYTGVTGTGTEIQRFITPVTGIGFSTIQQGVVNFHIHAKQAVTLGAKSAVLYFTLNRFTGGVLNGTPIGTSAITPVLTTTLTEYNTDFSLSAPAAVLSTDRLVVRVFVNVTGSGTDPNLEIDVGGTTDSRVDLPISLGTLTITTPQNLPAHFLQEVGDEGEVMGISPFVASSVTSTGTTITLGPGIGVDSSGILYNDDGGRLAQFNHESIFNHNLLRNMNLPFFKSDSTQQNVALNSIGNLPFFVSDGTESDIALQTPQVPSSGDILSIEVFT